MFGATYGARQVPDDECHRWDEAGRFAQIEKVRVLDIGAGVGRIAYEIA